MSHQRSVRSLLWIFTCVFFVAILLFVKSSKHASASRAVLDLSPFTEVVHPSPDTAHVRYNGELYELRSLEGIETKEILDYCKSKYRNRWDKRFAEDLVVVLEGMGKKVGDSVSLELRSLDSNEIVRIEKAPMTKGNRQAVWKARNAGTSNPVVRNPGLLDAQMQKQALVQFESALRERWSYFRTGIEIPGQIKDLSDVIGKQELSNNDFALRLNAIVATACDGHAGVTGYRLLPGKMPFLIEPVGERFVAFLPDRSQFIDPDYPFIEKIDGIEIETWCDKTLSQVVKGSQQYQKRHALRSLRSLNHWRAELGIKQSEEILLELSDAHGNLKAVKQIIDARNPIYGIWPRSESATLKNNIGYLRIKNMDDEAAEELITWMSRWKDTEGIIVDVRDNGGGSREALLTLASYLIADDEKPLVVNAAKYRLYPGFEKDHLAARNMYRIDSSQWNPRERQAILAFAKQFQPKWQPPGDEFSEWHYLVLSQRNNQKHRYHYSKPVVVLTNAKCFSATDIFVAGMKELSNVTLMGTSTGGGSARTTGVRISRGIDLRIGSMISYQTDGTLFDGNGVSPDIYVEPEPGYFVGQSDSLMNAAMEHIQSQRQGGK